ncbi:MAG: glycosyltransferase family 39 protein, partial [Actinomycetota bacterium]
MTSSFFARDRRVKTKPGSDAPANGSIDTDDTVAIERPDAVHGFGHRNDFDVPRRDDVDVDPVLEAILDADVAQALAPAADTAQPTVIGLGDAPSLGAVTDGRRRLRTATLRRVVGTVRRVHGWIGDADSDIVVLHTGARPTDERIESLIQTLDRPVDRGGGSMGRGRNVRRAIEVPDIVVEDDGSNATLTRSWQTLARRGAHAVTTGAPRAGNGSIAVIRRATVDTSERPARMTNRQFASWWFSIAFTVMFACWEAFRLVTTRSDLPRTTHEVGWLAAARAGTVEGIGDAPLPGSSMWPALAKPVLDVFGVAGLRWLALACAIGTITLSGVAASRLFGRWAGRTTSALLAFAFAFLDVSTAIGPTSLSAVALATALLGVALVEHHDRKSWILLAGLASTLAAVVAYQSIVFVGLLSLVFTVVRGRRGLNDSTTFRLVLAGGALAWFLPTRDATLAFVTTPRWRVDWVDLVSDTITILAAVGAAGAIVLYGSGLATARRRMMALGIALLGVPLSHVVSGSTLAEGTDLSLALVIAMPGVGGALAARFAAWRYGTEVTPAPRDEPEALVVDPSTGELRGRLVRYANRQVRIAVGLVVATSLWYLPWAFLNVDWRNWWIAVPFLFANLCMVGTALLSGYNNWNRAIPVPLDVASGHEPTVGVIVPTYSEPLYMVLNTVRSVFDQDWPADKLRVVVSDDAHDDTMRSAILAFAKRLPAGALLYNRPPKKGDPERKGESKSGNLNSAVLMLEGCEFVETRDADDLVGS